MSSRLDTGEVQKVAYAARRFSEAHGKWVSDQENSAARVDTLAWLAALEAAVDEMVSTETSKVEAILDGSTEEPPF